MVTVLVLLVACLNAAGLLLARGAARRRMLAISAALGAGRGRLVRQLLTESTVLSLGGGALGLAAAAVFLRAVPALAPGDVARLDEVRIDGVVFACTAGLSIVVGLLCGAGPAFQWSQLHLVRTLNDGSVQSAGPSGLLRTHRVRTTLSTMQVALAVMLLIGAGLLLRSFVQLLTFDRGFDPTNVVTATVTNPLGVAPHEIAAQRSQVMAEHQRLQERLFDETMTRLGSLPDVEAVGLSRYLPFGRNLPSHVPLRLAGTPVPSDPNEMVQTALQIASPGYLDAMRFRLRAGRRFTPLDGRERPARSGGQRNAGPRTLWKPAGGRRAGDRGFWRTLGGRRHRGRHRVRRARSHGRGSGRGVLPAGAGQREVLRLQPGDTRRGPDRR